MSQNKGWFKKGHSVSEELREKMRQSHIGKKHSEETKKKFALSHMGKKLSEETRKKISNSHLGIKPSKETRLKMTLSRSGEKSHLWKGGISFEPYTTDWTELLKQSIRERDNFMCQECGIQQDELIGWHKKLDVHHIDYNKKNCNPDNLITLCRSCHGKTTINRDYWISYFENHQLDKW